MSIVSGFWKAYSPLAVAGFPMTAASSTDEKAGSVGIPFVCPWNSRLVNCEG